MALKKHGRIVTDGSQTSREAIVSCDLDSHLQTRPRQAPKRIRIRNSLYLNKRIEQDHRRIKRRIRPMLGFKSSTAAVVILAGIEMVHRTRKRLSRRYFEFAAEPDEALEEFCAALDAPDRCLAGI